MRERREVFSRQSIVNSHAVESYAEVWAVNSLEAALPNILDTCKM